MREIVVDSRFVARRASASAARSVGADLQLMMQEWRKREVDRDGQSRLPTVRLRLCFAVPSRSHRRLTMRGGIDNEFPQRAIERVLAIRAIEPLIAIAPAGDQLSGFKFREFILHRLKREEREPRQLAHIQLLPGISEQQPENLRSDDREQLVQKCRARHSSNVTRPLKAVESKCDAEVHDQDEQRLSRAQCPRAECPRRRILHADTQELRAPPTRS